MAEYEARCMRFVSIGDFSVINERVFGPFRVKHMAYLFLSIMLMWSGLRGNASALTLSTIISLSCFLSDALSKGSMSFDAKAMLIASSLLDILLQLKWGGKVREGGVSK
ncbi:MAG: hypothetical protein QXS70_04370 [Desulfurococcaceae archaeon]